MASVTITVENSSGQVHQLRGRPARIAAWLVEQAEVLVQSAKGQIQIDYAGDHITIRNTQITEHRDKN